MCTNAPISFWGHLSRAQSHILEELWCGLCHLYGIVKRLEQTRLEQDPRAQDMMVTTFDGDCGSGDRMLLNYFLWYSCSADSFLDLFAAAFAVKKNPEVFNNMRKFRDNVGAHVPHDIPKENADVRRVGKQGARHFANTSPGIAGGILLDTNFTKRRTGTLRQEIGAGSSQWFMRNWMPISEKSFPKAHKPSVANDTN